MSVLYCMYEKAKSFGYIGLDNPGSKNFYPRVTDHIRAGYFGKRRDSTEQPDKIQQGTKFEQVVKNKGAYQFSCVATTDLESLVGKSFAEFSTLWKQNSRNNILSFAELCYSYEYQDSYAYYNDSWGGYADAFVLDIKTFFRKKGIREDFLETLGIKDPQITWSPKRGIKTQEDIQQLFYPEWTIFKNVSDLMLDNVWEKPAEDTIESFKNYQVNLKNNIVTIEWQMDKETIRKNTEAKWKETKKILNKIVEAFPSLVVTYNDKWIDNWIKAFSNKFDSIKNYHLKKASWLKGTYIDIKDKLFTIKLNRSAELPFWYPKNLPLPTTFTDIDDYVKKYSAMVLFPEIFKETEKDSSNKEQNIRNYLERRGVGIAQNDEVFSDYYHQHMNLYKNKEEGPATPVFDEKLIWVADIGERVAFRRSNWKQVAYVSEEFYNEVVSNNIENLKVY